MFAPPAAPAVSHNFNIDMKAFNSVVLAIARGAALSL
jgi:hypothetical protein